MPAIGQASVEAISLKPGGMSIDLVAVAHPDLEHAVALGRAEVLDAIEQRRVAARAHFGIAELAHLARLHLAAELLRHGLHAVADAEHRHAELEHAPAARAAVDSSYADMWLPERMTPVGRELAHERRR